MKLRSVPGIAQVSCSSLGWFQLLPYSLRLFPCYISRNLSFLGMVLALGIAEAKRKDMMQERLNRGASLDHFDAEHMLANRKTLDDFVATNDLVHKFFLKNATSTRPGQQGMLYKQHFADGRKNATHPLKTHFRNLMDDDFACRRCALGGRSTFPGYIYFPMNFVVVERYTRDTKLVNRLMRGLRPELIASERRRTRHRAHENRIIRRGGRIVQGTGGPRDRGTEGTNRKIRTGDERRRDR